MCALPLGAAARRREATTDEALALQSDEKGAAPDSRDSACYVTITASIAVFNSRDRANPVRFEANGSGLRIDGGPAKLGAFGGRLRMATITAGAESAPIHAASGQPSAPAQHRIETLDFIRGVALCGILLMNITGFGLADAYVNPANSGGATGINLWTWIITEVGFEGTQRALFSMLFGASIILLTSRLEAGGRTDVGDIYARRNLWLIGFGLVNSWILLWDGDILYSYGVIALFVFPFRKLSPRRLILCGLFSMALLALWNGYDTSVTLAKHDAYRAAVAARGRGARLTTAQTEAIKAWEEEREHFKSPPQEIRDDIAQHRAGYFSTQRAVARGIMFWQSRGLYRYFFDMFSMILIGMGLYRLGVLTLEWPARLYWTMLALGYGVGITANVIEVRWIMGHQFSAIAFAQTAVSYDLGRLAMTVGHLGALLLFARSGALGWLRRAFAAVGQMAVTNYLTHSLVGLILFTGLGWFGALERHQLYYIVFAIWAAQLVISPIWLRHFRFGPVEWLWRSLTYMKRQPMRRTAAA
jgi:uncharacterized protein